MNHSIFILFFQGPPAKDEEEQNTPLLDKLGFILHCSEGEHTPQETVGCLCQKIIGRVCYRI